MENLPKAFLGGHLLRWITTYPLDKVIRSLNNWGLNGAFMFVLMLLRSFLDVVSSEYSEGSRDSNMVDGSRRS